MNAWSISPWDARHPSFAARPRWYKNIFVAALRACDWETEEFVLCNLAESAHLWPVLRHAFHTYPRKIRYRLGRRFARLMPRKSSNLDDECPF
jgi:hypothetical protein